jgi:hypothetical protein
VQAITNTDYEGEIKEYGDTVKIIKEPEITVSDYKRGQEVVPQDIDDEELTLVVDQAKSYAFAVDDIESSMSHINWSSKALSSAGYALSNDYDKKILQYMHDNATDASGFGSAGSPVTIGFTGSPDFSPMQAINRMNRVLDENDVPDAGRFFVADPQFYELLGDEDSKLIEVQVTGDPQSMVRDKKMATNREVYGFTCFKSNNMPTSSSSDKTLLAGHVSATATANTLMKSESFRNPKSFGDIFRGLQVYGRKVLRPEALFTGYITY